MPFAVGQTVVHPHHGAAVVDDVESRELNGKLVEYLVLSAPDLDLTLRVPAETCSDVGLRECIDREQLDSVLGLLGEEGTPPTGHWSRRLKANQQRLRSGEPELVAQVLRDLTVKDEGKGLSPAERRLRDQARRMLLGEIAAVIDGDVDQAGALVDEALGLA